MYDSKKTSIKDIHTYLLEKINQKVRMKSWNVRNEMLRFSQIDRYSPLKREQS
jgi:hypothetical protein